MFLDFFVWTKPNATQSAKSVFGGKNKEKWKSGRELGKKELERDRKRKRER